MGAFDSIKKTIADLPISDIYKARIELVVDQLSEAQSKIGELQTQVGRVESERDRERLERQDAQRALQALREEHAEDVRIHYGIEFRRGKRTGGHWVGFCPQCHLPAADWRDGTGVGCSSSCDWSSTQVGCMAEAIRRMSP